jgi:hypothetical protein
VRLEEEEEEEVVVELVENGGDTAPMEGEVRDRALALAEGRAAGHVPVAVHAVVDQTQPR